MMQAAGLDVVHTLDLPGKNRTRDSAINRVSLDEKRIVVTKDADFVQSFLLQGRPYKLLLISTGNITNSDLLALISSKLDQIVGGFESVDYIELSREFIILHSTVDIPKDL